MKYDFETLVKRNGVGAYKWEAMKRLVPDLPDDIVKKIVDGVKDKIGSGKKEAKKDAKKDDKKDGLGGILNMFKK